MRGAELSPPEDPERAALLPPMEPVDVEVTGRGDRGGHRVSDGAGGVTGRTGDEVTDDHGRHIRLIAPASVVTKPPCGGLAIWYLSLPSHLTPPATWLTPEDFKLPRTLRLPVSLTCPSIACRALRPKGTDWRKSTVDIAVAGLGWVGVGCSGPARFRLWTLPGVAVTTHAALVPDYADEFERPGLSSLLPKAAARGSTAQRDKERQERRERREALREERRGARAEGAGAGQAKAAAVGEEGKGAVAGVRRRRRVAADEE